MNIHGSTVLLTGACGGIGRAIAQQLVGAGASVVVSSRNRVVLDALADDLRSGGGNVLALPADLTAPGASATLVQQAQALTERIDVLVHCAGVQSFSSFVQEDEATADRLLALNALVPMQLTRALLPQMLRRRHGRIVLIGSLFGSIGFPFFVSYSASKFALRGFAEALRRELAGSGVGVTYVAPRFTKTAFNRRAVVRMAESLHMAQDEPVAVAARVLAALDRDGHNQYLGWPEKLFVYINSLLPRLIDRPLKRQTDKIRPFAVERR
jgi:short-subunit dehydrogenase